MSIAPLPLPVPGWPVVFRGSLAIAAGRVTPGELRGPRFVRLVPDIYAPAGADPPDLSLRSLGAYLFARGKGVVSGYSAAELWEASCGPADAPAEIIVPGGGVHPCAGLLVRRDVLAPDEVTRCAGVRSPRGGARRTTWDDDARTSSTPWPRWMR